MQSEILQEKGLTQSRFFKTEQELLQAFIEYRNRENHVYADIEVEKIVLGTLLTDSEAYYRISDLLKKTEIFYQFEHQLLFSTIKEIILENKQVDIVMLTSRLMQSQLLEQAGGAAYIYQLTSRVVSANNLEFHCRILVQMFIKRQIQHFCINMLQQLNMNVNSDVNDYIEMFYTETDSYNDFGTSRPIHKVSELLPAFEEKINEMQNDESDYSDATTGFDEIDSITNGLSNGDMVVIAARPSIGKTALALSMSDRMVKKGFPVGFFSAEMNNMQLVKRIASMNTGINSKLLSQRGKFKGEEGLKHWEKLQTFIDTYKFDFFIEDTPNILLSQLRYKAKRMKRLGAKVILIDYLQLLQTGRNSQRYDEVTNISSGIKALAKELDLPIIILSQLNRSSESKDKRPELSHLRESGAIEQDADIVMLIHRPEFYGIQEFMYNDFPVDTKGKALVYIDKNRNGAIGEVMLSYSGPCTKFGSCSENDVDTENIPF